MEIIKEERGLYPVLLLDDVFSELDIERRSYLTRSFNHMQTIITSTDIIDLEELKENRQISIPYREGTNNMKKE